MNPRLYEESIILIGPSGAGKSTVAAELVRMTNMKRLCLDGIINRIKKTGIASKFKTTEEFYYYVISEVLEWVKTENLYGIVDFGAGHSVYDDEKIFEKIKQMLKPFKNIVLLLPDIDIETSLLIMENRSTGDTRENRKFIESPCNQELATMTVYANNRPPAEIAKEIIYNIQHKQSQQP